MKGVIVYLSRKHDINDLKNSLKLLKKNFTKKFNYPILIFHDDFTNNDQRILLKIYSYIKFERLKFEIPSWIEKSRIIKGSNLVRVGVLHFNRFFSGEFYKHFAIKNYDWYWRLDSDSFILSPIKYDIFKFMERQGFIHAYLGKTLLKDHPDFVIGLWDLTKDYMRKKNILPKFLNKFLEENGEYNRSLYYTNFEISKLDFWRSKEYQEYYKMIDQNGGLYYHRWGDHTIHTLALAMLIDENKIHCFQDIDYIHQEFRPNIPEKKNSFLRRAIISSSNFTLHTIKIIKNKTERYIRKKLKQR